MDDSEAELEERPSLIALEGEIARESDEDINDTLRSAADNGFPRRQRLSVEHNHEAQGASLWSVLKKNIGKKLSHIAMVCHPTLRLNTGLHD